LAAKPKNPSALAFIDLKTLRVSLSTLYKTPEILSAITLARPVLTAIDAPLSPPKGGGGFRKAELLLRRVYGCKTLPLTLPSMRKLHERGVKIARALEKAGLRVIEVHPSSTRRLLGWAGLSDEELRRELVKTGLGGDLEKAKPSRHELDAVLAALTALYYLFGRAAPVGDPDEGVIVIPCRR